MSTKFELSASQFSDIRRILKIPKTVTFREFKNNVDSNEFKIKGSDSVYTLINYKPYLEDIDIYWKQFRGVIIKNYDHIISDSNGYTPTLTINRNIPNTGNLLLTETLENGATVEHKLNFTPKSFYIRPAFQGTMIRVSLTDGQILKSTLRKGSIENSIWPSKEESKEKAVTFGEKFDLLCRYGKELFTPDKMNSPYCHIFLMCVPQVLSASHIECGEGFVIYLETIKCYEPDKKDETEEQESYLLSKISEDVLTQEEKEAGILTVKDQLFFPLSNSDDLTRNFSKFVPPAIDIDFLKQYAAVFMVDTSMNNKEANDFLVKGVSNITEIDKVTEVSRLLLPGEGLYYKGYNDKGNKVSYLIVPECYNYRAATIGDPNNSMNQLVKLRQLPMDTKTITVFNNTLNADNIGFHDVAFPVNEKYYALNSALKFKDFNFDILHPSKNISMVTEDDIIRSHDKKLDVVAYFYILALPESRREHAYSFYQKIKTRIVNILDYIIENRKELSDVESELYKKKAMTYQKYFEASKIIRDIIELASKNVNTEKYTKISTSPTKKNTKAFSLPQKKTLVAAPSTFKKSEKVETNDINTQRIIQLLNELDALSLYRIISLVNLLKQEE